MHGMPDQIVRTTFFRRCYISCMLTFGDFKVSSAVTCPFATTGSIGVEGTGKEVVLGTSSST